TRGTLANAGTIDVAAGTGGSRALGAELSNTGTITFDLAAGLGRQGAHHVNAGTIVIRDARLYLSGDSFTNTADGLVVARGSGGFDLYPNLRVGEQLLPAGTMDLFSGKSADSPQLLEAMSQDLGNTPPGFNHNFAQGALVVERNTYLRLVDSVRNSAGTDPEALYVDSLIVTAGSTLDLNGLHVYARVMQIDGATLNGAVTLVADGGAIERNRTTPGALSAAGEVDDWTFFGRAGEPVALILATGDGGAPAPLPMHLDYGQVSLVGPDGQTIGTAGNSQTGADAALLDATLPAAGTYHVHVADSADHADSTGNYLLTAWDAPVHTTSLDLDQTVTGRLATPYSIDHWTFAAAAGQQVRFDLVNATSGAIQFDLTGPAGYTAFSNLTQNSDLITLPSAGPYVVTVHVLAPSRGSYAFQLEQTPVTDLAPG